MMAHVHKMQVQTEPSGERKSDACYKAIRSMIIDFRLKPGAFIDKSDLCRLLKVSRQPVTSALSRLEREGLVEILPQRGSYVARLSLSGLVESLSIRAALEDYAARRLAEMGEPEQIAELDGALDDQRRAIDDDDDDVFAEANMRFHRSIAGSTGFPKLVEQVDIGLAASARTMRVLTRAEWMSPQSVDEHAAIVTAIRDGRDETAGRLAHAHVVGFKERVVSFARARPDLFAQ